MTDQTILVVDADQETGEKIVSILEQEGYLVFSASGRDIIAGTAENINPSLIFLKPASNSVQGFNACKKIHASAAFKDIPIVVLASFKGPLDPRYTTFYGIVDYLKLPVSPPELLEKTGKILGVEPRLKPEEVIPDFSEEIPEPPAEEESSALKEYPVLESSVESGFTEEEIGKQSEDYIYDDEEDNQESPAGERTEHKQARRGGVRPVFVISAAIAVLIAGFLLYRFFFFSSDPGGAPSALERQKQPPAATEVQQKPPAETGSSESDKGSEPADLPVEASRPPVQQAEKSIKPFYSVQLGAFQNQSSADAVASAYKLKGYETFTQKGATAENKTVYRALVGKFESRNEALKQSKRLGEKEKVNTIIFRQDK